jgi:hypothetical protein
LRLGGEAAKLVLRGQGGVNRVENCHKEVATDGVRKATRSRASGSPLPGEGRTPERPGQTKETPFAKPRDQWGPLSGTK